VITGVSRWRTNALILQPLLIATLILQGSAVALHMPALPAFFVDSPSGTSLARIERFTGWCLGPFGKPASGISLYLDDTPVLTLNSMFRDDINQFLIDRGGCSAAGFAGDLVLPDDLPAGRTVSVAIEASFPFRRAHPCLSAKL